MRSSIDWNKLPSNQQRFLSTKLTYRAYEGIAVLSQFGAEVITQCLYLYTKCLVTDMRKIYTKQISPEALTIIILLAPAIKKVDSDIQWGNLYPVHSAINFLNTYPVDSDLSNLDSTIQLLNNWGLVIFAGIALKLE